MAEGPAGGRPAAPEHRGTTVVADRVVEKVAAITAVGVDGVARTGSGVEKVLGRDYPRVEATVAGRRVRLRLEVAAVWPAPLPRVTAAVRAAVRERVESLLDLHVDAVDVAAGKVIRGGRRGDSR